LDKFGNIDSKYRFIILASKRAKQLLKGAKPKIRGKSKSLIRIAQAEVRAGLIEYEIIPARMDDVPERDERVFVGAGIADEAVESDGPAGKDLVEDGAEVETDEVPGEREEDEEAESDDEGLKEDKDE
jgi:DNA-directed RNA polymerase subunit K/omega